MMVLALMVPEARDYTEDTSNSDNWSNYFSPTHTMHYTLWIGFYRRYRINNILTTEIWTKNHRNESIFDWRGAAMFVCRTPALRGHSLSGKCWSQKVVDINHATTQYLFSSQQNFQSLHHHCTFADFKSISVLWRQKRRKSEGQWTFT